MVLLVEGEWFSIADRVGIVQASVSERAVGVEALESNEAAVANGEGKELGEVGLRDGGEVDLELTYHVVPEVIRS